MICVNLPRHADLYRQPLNLSDIGTTIIENELWLAGRFSITALFRSFLREGMQTGGHPVARPSPQTAQPQFSSLSSGPSAARRVGEGNALPPER
jgi:hypothetical protein